MTKTTLLIEDMHCANCAFRIDGVLEDLDGVEVACTSYARAKTEVRYDPVKLSAATLVEALRQAGYTARPQS